MKVLSGYLRGRSFEQPKNRLVRPLSEKVRGAIFDITGVPEAAVVLDVYAGSGAAGFEALSRGASMVEAIEGDIKTSRIIERNAKHLELNWEYVLHTLKVETWLALPINQVSGSRPSLQRYDVIVADPPYAELDLDVLERLLPFLNSNGILALSHSSKREAPVLLSGKLVQHKVYGDTAVSFYRGVS